MSFIIHTPQITQAKHFILQIQHSDWLFYCRYSVLIGCLSTSTKIMLEKFNGCQMKSQISISFCCCLLCVFQELKLSQTRKMGHILFQSLRLLTITVELKFFKCFFFNFPTTTIQLLECSIIYNSIYIEQSTKED